MKCHPMSETLVEMAAEMTDPAKWLAMMLVKGGRPKMSAEEAFAMIEGLCRHAIARAKESDTKEKS